MGNPVVHGGDGVDAVGDEEQEGTGRGAEGDKAEVFEGQGGAVQRRREEMRGGD